MCTCGIAMATQHAMPATHSKAISVFGEMPSRPCAWAAIVPATFMSCRGARRRSGRIASGSMVTAHSTPIPMWVARQPSVAMKCCTTGGQIVPAR